MSWKYLPIGLLCLSVGLVVLGIVALFNTNAFDYRCIRPNLPVYLCGIGVAGVAFVAWLKKG